MPDRPASRRDELVSTPQPSGDTAPIPVTTIRRIFYPVSICALTCLTWQRQLGLANFLVTPSPGFSQKRAASGSRHTVRLIIGITTADAVFGSHPSNPPIS